MKISMNSLYVGIFLLFCSFNLQGQCVNFSFEESFDGTDLLVDLRVENFNDILSIQMAFGYTSEKLNLLEVVNTSSLNISPFNFNLNNPGYIAFVWNSSTGESLEDDSSLIQFRFEVLDSAPSSILILDQEPLVVEIINGDIEEICYTSQSITINDNRAKILGKVSHDLNDNCTEDIDDKPLEGWKVRATSGTETYYATTKNGGYYKIPVELGDYTVEVLLDNELWEACENSQIISVVTEGDEYPASFVMDPVVEASLLSVSLKAPRLRRCFDNKYEIKYKNDGTIASTNTKIEIFLDENLDFEDANINGVSIDGQVITADLGILESGEDGTFNITVNVNCDNTVLGETLCAEAEITSDDSTIPPSEWEGAVLMAEVACVEDSIEVIFTNIGNNDVLSPLGFIVIEDDVMFHSNETNPLTNQQRSFKFEDNDAVYRVVVDQPAGYPFGRFETDFVQSCDGDNQGTYEFVSMFPNADDAPIVDIECHEVIGSYDPNDILAYPAGYRENNQIEANQDIEYTIRFQNTGTDTAFNIAIENTIDPSLDIEMLIEGSSSHEYDLTILEGGTLRFDFYNVLLPHSAIDDLGSNGFVSYKISQKQDLEIGTEINNTAEIYFDFNDAIVTNTYRHRIGEEYVEIILDDENILLDNELVTAPNPASDMMRIEVPVNMKDLSYVLYNKEGLVINAANCAFNVFYINKGMMLSGMYVLELKSENRTIGRKKLIFN